MEVWKHVPGYEGIYKVSNLGRLKSFSRKNEVIIKHSISTSGYPQFTLTKEKIKKTFPIHKIVSMAFLNHIPCGYKLVVDHINGIKTDNRVENLQLISNRENTSKALNRKSKFIGVSYNKLNNTWIARLGSNGNRKHLGVFKCETKAHLAYQKALKELLQAK